MKGLGRGFESLIPTELIDDEFDPTAVEDKKESKLKELKLDDIIRDEEQPRRDFNKEALDALAASIKEHGVLQPIVVTKEEGKYKIVAGERRWRAAKIAGLKKIPAIVRSLDSQNRLELSIIENAQREDLNAIELATAYAKLKTQFNLSTEDIAAKVGKSEQTVQNTLRLLTLPDDVKKTMVKEKLTEGVMRPLVSRDEETIRKVLPRIVKEGWTARQVERYFAETTKKSSTKALKRDAYRKDEDKLSAKYNVVTKITGRSLTFKCKNDSELKSLVKKLIGILVFVTLTAGFFLLNHETFADSEVVDIVTLTIPSSCTLTSSAGDGATYTMNLTPGQYKNDIGPSTLSVFCNNNEGFSIYAVGFSNNEHGNNKMLTSTQDRYIATGTNTSGTPSSWAMKLTAVTASGDNAYTPTIVSPFNNFSNVPTSHAKVATVTSVSNGNAEASVQATYAVYVANAQVADTYTGKVKYTVVHPASNVPNEPKACSANKICYWPNAGNEVNDKMGDQSANYADNTNTITSNMDINLWPSHYKRTGYGFAGWSDAYDYVANVGSASNPNAHIYGPIENIHLDDMSSGLSLYAVWVPSAGYLQGWTGCTALQQGNVTALTDARDNDTYAVAKLADGNCWMIENLRLDYNANFDESLSQGFGKSTYYGSFIGLAAPETNLSNSTTANSLYKSDNSGDIKGVNGATLSDIGTGGIPGHRFPRYRNTNTSAASSNMTGPNQNIYSYGNYYNWPAALANVIWYSGPNATVDGYTSETVGTSLCPASWKLPRSGDKTKMESGTNDFYTLALDIIGTAPANYSSSNTPYWANGTEGTNASKEIRSYPNNFIYSGQAYSSSIANRGEAGYYWSSTVSNFSSYYTHYFSFSSMNVYPVSGADRYYGATIRCVLSN